MTIFWEPLFGDFGVFLLPRPQTAVQRRAIVLIAIGLSRGSSGHLEHRRPKGSIQWSALCGGPGRSGGSSPTESVFIFSDQMVLAGALALGLAMIPCPVLKVKFGNE